MPTGQADFNTQAQVVGPVAGLPSGAVGTVLAGQGAGVPSAYTGTPTVTSVTFAGDSSVLSALPFSTQTLYGSPARQKDTVYRNTSGKPKLVTVSIALTASTGDAAVAYSSPNTPPTDIPVGRLATGALTGVTVEGMIVFIVPNNYYYEIVTDAGTITINNWVEYT